MVIVVGAWSLSLAAWGTRLGFSLDGVSVNASQANHMSMNCRRKCKLNGYINSTQTERDVNIELSTFSHVWHMKWFYYKKKLSFNQDD